MSKGRAICSFALGLVLIGVVGLVSAWAVDMRSHRDRVARNTVLGGQSIGGMGPIELASAVRTVTNRYAVARVEVRAPGGGFSATTTELGLAIDPEATARAAREAGRSGALPTRFWSWTGSFRHRRQVPLRFRVDTAAVHAIVAARDPLRTPPVEPFVKAKPGGSGFTIVEAKPGKGIDADAVVAALPKAAAQGEQIVVQVGRGSVPPRISKAQAEALAKRAERDVAKPVTVTAGPAKATIPVSTLRTWFHSQAEGDQLSLVIDPATALAALPKLLPKATTPAVETTFTVTGNQPQPKFGRAGSTCCGDAAPGLIQQAVLEGSRSAGSGTTASPVQLPLRTVPPRINPENLATVGIKEQVATFTTNHPAGQPRVTNIHRMADMVKGQVIMPGETFSLNGFVGERTVAKGFVVDHQINDEGKFDEAVGGGVSQFATTTFNAAFFAGLDFGEYQSHTIYISRYPYGREATVSWRHPDLQVKNTTPFGVLLWADYTGTSLTVRMFSTKFLASVTQSAQSQAPFGPGCTRVTTERTRTYLDGRTAIDKLFALYQPAEGVKCR